MLYEYILVVLSVGMAIVIIFSYRLGIKDGRAIKDKRALPKVIEFSGVRINKEKPTNSQEHYDMLLENINSYDGTPVKKGGK